MNDRIAIRERFFSIREQNRRKRYFPDIMGSRRCEYEKKKKESVFFGFKPMVSFA